MNTIKDRSILFVFLFINILLYYLCPLYEHNHLSIPIGLIKTITLLLYEGEREREIDEGERTHLLVLIRV